MNKKIVTVTGANGFLGSRICEEFLRQGWEVVKLTHKDIQNFDGTPDALVHAGWPPFTRTKLADTAQKEWQMQFAAAEISFIFLSAVGHRMKERGSGTIVGITTAGLDSEDPAVAGAYLPAKAALRQTLKLLKSQMHPVVVHEVAPGFMAGGLNSDLPPRLFEMMDEKGLLDSPEAVAKKIATLCTDTSSTSGVL